MANIVKIKRSAVASKIPTTTDLELGELAINTFDGKLFTRKDDGTASIIEIGSGGGGITYSLKTANYTAKDKDGILANTTAGSFTVTLPASPAIGASVVINDAADSFGTNNLIVARNGSTIETIADNLILDLSSVSVSFIYTGTTWQVYSLVVTSIPGGTLPVTSGGTGTASLTSNNIILGNGTSPVQFIAPGISGNVLTSDGTTWTSQQSSGGTTYLLKTANYTASDKDGILADTTANAFTITLPTSPAVGFCIVINDAADNFGINNLTVARNGSTIESNSENLVLDVSGISVTLIYTGTTWQVYTQFGATQPNTSNLGGINYVVKNANYTLVNRDGIIADSSLGSFTLTLPATPAPGDQVVIADGNDFSTNNVIVARNGSTIENLSENLTLNIQGASVTFIYSGVTWQVYTQIGAQGTLIEASVAGDIIGGSSNQILYQSATDNTSFIPAPSTAGSVLKYSGSAFTWGQAGLIYTIKTSAYNASNNDALITDTSAAPFTITLPSTPSVGDSILFLDKADWSVNNLTISRNGSTIENLSENLILNIKGIQVQLVYDGTTWNVFAFTGPDGITVTENAASAGPVYIPWVGASSGYSSTNVTSSKLYFSPSTGTLNTTDYNSLSDITLKDNVETLADALNVVDNLNPVHFTWKDSGKDAFGFIAQEIEEVLPSIVYTNPETGIKSVSYIQLIPILLQAIKELRQEIKGDLNGNT